MLLVKRTTCSAASFILYQCAQASSKSFMSRSSLMSVCTRDFHYFDNRAEPQSPFKHNNNIHHNPIRTYPASKLGKWLD